MEIHQFVHTLNYGDAISGEALAIQRILSDNGVGGNIYSVHVHEKLQGSAKHFREFEGDIQGRPEASVLLHYSIASPLNDLFLQTDHISRAMIYHNLTPPKWFRNYNSRVYDDLKKGAKELPFIAASADLVLADSTFNKDELAAHIRQEITVLPLLFDEVKWSVPANGGIAKLLRSSGQVNLLHVGRLAPNKCIEDVIKIFYFYHHKINRQSKLWLVGIDIDTEIYSFELRRMISHFNLKKQVEFVGAVADSELRSFYENSQVYLCMSEHEGFCLPLLEAMSFGLPVMALNACAVAETVDEAGVLVERKEHPLLAELVDKMVTDNALRQDLIERGRARVKEFGEKRFAANLLEHLVRPLKELRVGESPRGAHGSGHRP